MEKLNRICISSLALFVFMVFTSSVSLAQNSSEKTGKLRTVKIGINTWIGFGPFALGEEKGIFAKHGIDLKLMIIEGTGQFKAAMLAGQVDGIGMTLDTLIMSANQGIPLEMILALDESVGADGVVATKDIKTIEDLKGKTVAYQSGFPGHFLLLYLLNNAGLTEKDIKPQLMETSLAGAAFISKKVDAAVTWEPWLSKASKSEHGHIVASTLNHKGVIVDMLAMAPDFIRNEPKVVEKIVQGWFESLEYWKNNRQEADTIMANFYKMSVEEFTGILEGVAFCDSKRNLTLFGTKDKRGKIYDVAEKAGKIWHNLITKKNQVAVSRIINDGFVVK